MSDLGRGADVEKLMHLLMHDIRSPLGVAQGYISLLGGQTLSADDRVRALRGVSDAISRISGLVDDVATLMTPEETEGRWGFVDASMLCERVSLEARRRGIEVASREVCSGAKVRVGTSVDRLAEAILIALSPPERAPRGKLTPMILALSRTGTELGFRMGRNDSAHPSAPELAAFDPGTIGSVEHLKANRQILSLQGLVWREVGETRACAVTLPLSS
ncbi:MAG TPA: histidine kinase dimerization/phospho-acceptor domain-containing protein [Vicinamibacterales bacterium]|nr:histidine kinase dimerization/phospho-acceptor domain-containing protein [Vicinamibacterales bacterium]